MTPVERAVAAIVTELGRQRDERPYPWALGYFDADDPYATNIDGSVDLHGIVRAVLMAIRQPSEGMVFIGEDVQITAEGETISDDREVSVGSVAAREVWQAMIDAALEEDRSQKA